MLCLAWTFSSLISNQLGTGHYLAQLLVGSLPLFMLPVIFFFSSIVTTVAIGSSWGAIAIMVAIAVPMVLTLTQVVTPTTIEHIYIMLPVLGAILSGAIAGNTISPIGDATIMASTSTQTYHEDHVKTQWAYNLPAIIATGFSFSIYCFLASYTSLFISVVIALTIGIGLSCILLSYQHRNELIKKKEKKRNAQ
jgi:tetracycline resistance efflux pump